MTQSSCQVEAVSLVTGEALWALACLKRWFFWAECHLGSLLLFLLNLLGDRLLRKALSPRYHHQGLHFGFGPNIHELSDRASSNLYFSRTIQEFYFCMDLFSTS